MKGAGLFRIALAIVIMTPALIFAQDLPLPGLNSPSVDFHPDITSDGGLIVFQSDRPGGAGREDVYLYDRQVPRLVPLPGLNSSGADFAPTISIDGRFIAFASTRTGGVDIYLYDRRDNALVSLPGLNTGQEENFPVISGDGRFILYRGRGSGGDSDIYLYDRQEQLKVSFPEVNTRDQEDNPALSDDGRYIAFFRERASMSGGFLGDFLFDRETRQLQRLTDGFRVTDLGADAGLILVLDRGVFDRRGNRFLTDPANPRGFGVGARLSHDGRYIVGVTFQQRGDIFLYQRGN